MASFSYLLVSSIPPHGLKTAYAMLMSVNGKSFPLHSNDASIAFASAYAKQSP
jgi:hypothetical protein